MASTKRDAEGRCPPCSPSNSFEHAVKRLCFIESNVSSSAPHSSFNTSSIPSSTPHSSFSQSNIPQSAPQPSVNLRSDAENRGGRAKRAQGSLASSPLNLNECHQTESISGSSGPQQNRISQQSSLSQLNEIFQMRHVDTGKSVLTPLQPEARSDASHAAGSAPSLDDLGPDLLLHILRKAHPTAWDLCRMACVSRTWRQLCYSRVFWTKLRVSSGSIRPGVEALAAQCSGVAELHIDDPRCELFILHPLILACASSLQRLVINCDKDTTTRNEAAICSILWIISLHCKNVESVELQSKGEQGGFDYIDNKALWYLTSGFRNIRSFTCLCKDSMTKQSLYLMVIAWRDLACLRIHCGRLLKDDFLCLRKCHALRVLELFGGDLGMILEGQREDESENEADGNGMMHMRGSPKPGMQPVFHAELEVLVLSNTTACPAHLATLVQSFPGLKRVLLNKESWAHGTPLEVQEHRRQFALLQQWLLVKKQVELLLED